MMKYIVFLLILFGFNSDLTSQESIENQWDKIQSDYKIKVSMGLQLWTTYSLGQEVYDLSSSKYTFVEDRINTQLRRTRMNFSGQPYKNLKFKITASIDLVGKDLLASSQGGANNGSSPIFRLWNALADWKIKSTSDLYHVTVGYIPPQIGRESITSALKSSSFEKAWSQNYLRRNIVGIGPGRAMGVNIGGQKIGYNKTAFSYDLGVFSPEAFGLNGNSSGLKYAPLFAGRFAFYFGDPESNSYTLSHKVNYFGKRKGLTLALAGAYQGETELFNSNTAYSVDWLWNFMNFNLDGEWTIFSRSGQENSRDFEVESNSGYIRLGYNWHIKGTSYIEPVVLFVKFNGSLDADGQRDAAIVKTFAGTDQIIDVGFNYHLNPDLKLSFSYTMNQGSKGPAADGVTFNNYYDQSGYGAIRRGNQLGVGLVANF